MAGYSGKPLIRKLGYKSGSCINLLNAPENYQDLLGENDPSIKYIENNPDIEIEVVHLFVTERERLISTLEMLRDRLNPKGYIWVSWPKKSSKVDTDITEDIIREVALPMGYVDIKVCAVSEIWSGLKLVIRKELR